MTTPTLGRGLVGGVMTREPASFFRLGRDYNPGSKEGD